MRNSVELRGFVGALVALVATACASGGDANSRELMAISHQATPDGSLSVNDDGRYSFIDSTKEIETHGTLTSAELADVKAHVVPAQLDSLYAHGNPIEKECAKVDDAYVLISKRGSACFVISTISDASAKSDLMFFVSLFNEKSGTQ